jgi:hypothetical protein
MLTEKVIRGLQPRSTRYLVCDFDCLYIEVLPSGVKSWVYRRAVVNFRLVSNAHSRAVTDSGVDHGVAPGNNTYNLSVGPCPTGGRTKGMRLDGVTSVEQSDE